MPDYSLEQQHCLPGALIAGVDEAGRGPWAGPVVAGAVILDASNIPDGLDDSKKLDARKRRILYAAILQSSTVGVGLASVEEIDTINILQASLLAMRRAVEDLNPRPGFLLIDGLHTPHLEIPSLAVVKGDGRSLSIAAASIVAKVTRDQIMADLAKSHPAYGWETNAGYGTAAHRDALDMVGISPHHRKSFKPIRELMTQDSNITF